MNIRSTSATRSRRWNGFDSTLASESCGPRASDRGKAGDEHDADAGRDLGRLLGELDAVHFRHDDVGQQQIERLAFEQRNRRCAAIDRNNLIADPLERAGQIDPHRFVVFGEENPQHLGSLRRSSP